VTELEGCIYSLQEQIEQQERAHEIQVKQLKRQLQQADNQAETLDRLRHDELEQEVMLC
jgi:hypothetical protein